MNNGIEIIVEILLIVMILTFCLNGGGGHNKMLRPEGSW